MANKMVAISEDHDAGVLRLVLAQPILAVDLLEELAAKLDSVNDRRLPMIISSAHPRIFLAGAHLAEIARLDATTSLDYGSFGRAVLQRLGRHQGPVVAAVHGPCSGGGFDFVLSADAIVAGPAATFSHPGVRRGLVTGWGGTMMLPRLLGPASARRILLEGATLNAAELAASGLVCRVDDDPLAAAMAEAKTLGELHPSRILFHRSLRTGGFR